MCFKQQQVFDYKPLYSRSKLNKMTITKKNRAANTYLNANERLQSAIVELALVPLDNRQPANHQICAHQVGQRLIPAIRLDACHDLRTAHKKTDRNDKETIIKINWGLLRYCVGPSIVPLPVDY